MCPGRILFYPTLGYAFYTWRQSKIPSGEAEIGAEEGVGENELLLGDQDR
jgi:hypothetical protein